MLAVQDARVARKREQEWLGQPRDLSQILGESVSTAPATASEGEREELPLDDLLYWVRSARMLGDLQGLATAQVERLRARCIAAGMPEADLDRRIEEALPDARATETVAPAGWYADPAGGGARRYWTGATWTQRVR